MNIDQALNPVRPFLRILGIVLIAMAFAKWFGVGEIRTGIVELALLGIAVMKV